MKYFKYSVLVLIFFLLFISTTRALSEFPLLGKVIYVDAGHGGRDPGVIYGNIYEKDINLEIAKKLEEKLSLLGATVFMIRDYDIDYSSIYDSRKKRGDLYRRIKKIDENELETDLYLSIHINWYTDGYYRGAEVLYSENNIKNKILAESIMNSLKNDTKTKREVRTTDLYMYKYIKTPGVLIECGFLSNYKERTLLQDESYQDLLASSISDGVISYFDNI